MDTMGTSTDSRTAPTVGSLFAGIGGFDLGLERAGFQVKWQVEIDPFCRRVLEKHWPHVRRYEDVRTVGGGLERVDVICGGFPCQDISVAGKGAGLAGERSGLWSEYVRLIRQLQPRYVVVENVAALLGRGLGDILGNLAACGYDAEWDCLPASAFGARHRRDRVWIVAYPGHGGQRELLQSVSELRRGAAADARRDGKARPVADAGCEQAWPVSAAGRETPRIWDEAAADFRERGSQFGATWSVEPNVGRVAHGVPARVDRLRGLGNSIVPQIAEWIGRRILEAEAATVTEAGSVTNT